jgi:hypothetical protein
MLIQPGPLDYNSPLSKKGSKRVLAAAQYLTNPQIRPSVATDDLRTKLQPMILVSENSLMHLDWLKTIVSSELCMLEGSFHADTARHRRQYPSSF